jgi:amino acid transporter/mannitol/fructose-specific phosphotransferase system IIA component (Ntr-type)
MELKRSLNFLHVFCIASGAMISSGLFILPGIAHAQAGPAVVLSYLFAALLAGCGMLSQAELVTAMPKSGGTYFYVKRSMGSAVGTVDGLLTWFSLSLKSSFALIGMAAFTQMVLPSVDIRLIAVALTVVFVVMNIIGTKEAGWIQVGLVAGLLGILGLYIFNGLPKIDVMQFQNFAPNGLKEVFAASGLVFVSYGGLLKVASVAEEVKDPTKTIPRAMILSLFTVSLFYFLVVFVTTGVLDHSILNDSLTPISDGALVFLGKPGMLALSIAAILAFISTANAGIMAASRYPLALSRDKLIPERLGKIHPKFHTPYIAIIITGFFMMISLFLPIKSLVKAASTVLLMTFIFSCISVIIMRESHLQNYRPQFKSPLYPWVQIIGILGCIFLLFGMGIVAISIAALLIISGLLFYFLYGRIRAHRESALMYIIERMTSKKLTDHILETELKEIIRERDDIQKDRFDHIIESCEILDLAGPLKRDEFFHKASKVLAQNLGMTESDFFSKMVEREEESTTALTPTLAIPHIILDGKDKFAILPVRCKKGIKFSDESEDIKIVFVIAGTKEERPFHLKTLAAIAQSVQNPHFEERWMRSKKIENLRDTILLAKRRRL